MLNNQLPPPRESITAIAEHRDVTKYFKMDTSYKNEEYSKLYMATSVGRQRKRRIMNSTFLIFAAVIIVNLVIPTTETQASITTVPSLPAAQTNPTIISLNQPNEQEVHIRQSAAHHEASDSASSHLLTYSTSEPPSSLQHNNQKTSDTTNYLQLQRHRTVVTSEQTGVADTQTTTTTQTTTKAGSVLRSSIEEVASKLSRKHLNLEHENWRLKVSSLASPQAADQFQADITSSSSSNYDDDLPTRTTTGAIDNSAVAHGRQIVDAEQEIKVSSSHHLSPNTDVANSSVSQQQIDGSSSSSPVKKSNNHYLHIDVATSGDSGSQAATKHKQQRYSSQSPPTATNSRRKKGGTVFQQSYYEDNELFQCHQYLQYHSSPQTLAAGSVASSPVFNAGLSRLVSSQLLPCSCEPRQRQHDSEPSSATESTWLSCDNVQLMGSHFYTPPTPTTNAFNNNTPSANDDGYKILFVTKFSQRDSGLQTLHAQKFHYLQLFHLKSIDLSNNRIRLIKMDAFHGLEYKLEYLNLANNLLGDSRALSNEKLIFSSDELNRLRKLKWLSLHNNQINQLGPTIFYKSSNPSSTTTPTPDLADTPNNADTLNNNNNNNDRLSELTYLDLSENLLNSIPSESIYQLSELKILDLSRNRITQLDQFSKFPQSLRYLDLSENLIRNVRQCNLIDLPNLVELNLSHNQLSYLDKTAFISSSSSLANNLVLAPDSSSSALNNGHDNLSPRISSSIDTSSALSDAADPFESDGGSSRDHLLARYARNANDDTDQLQEEGTVMSGQDSSRENYDDDDLDTGESIIASMKTGRQTLSDEFNVIQHMNPFNSTLKLNLSHNLFENVPGDTLLKFTNLQQLDLSYNRIRKLDSNYFCSIYNLVENLRYLDLSGNLLSISKRDNNSNTNDNGKHLNKLFGCLLRLEKLLLSTNRLAAATDLAPGGARMDQAASDDPSPMATAQDQEDYIDQSASESNNAEQFVPSNIAGDRLIIKFGEGFVSRYLNTLDLSDNQLNQMPIIEQIGANPIVSLNVTSLSNLSSHQSNLNQWINSRMYLESLNLNYNSIERLDERDFEHLFNLQHLYLDNNKLTSLPIKLMRRFTSLDRLSLNGNAITSLSPLNELLERTAKTLRLLNLANNRLTEWPQIITKSNYLNDGYQQQQQQQYQTLNYDDPQAIGFSLEELNLEGNQLTSDNVTSLFDQLLYMKSLRILNLKFNLLNRVKSEWFKFANKNLQTLLMTGNKINSVDLGSFAWNQVNELIRLDLDHNLVRELKRKTFDSLPKLRELNLGNNLIHTINSETFHQVNSLQILRLNNNRLTSWKCEYFSNLCNPTSGAINAELSSILVSSVNPQQQQQQQQSSYEQQNPIPPSVSGLIELDLSHNSLSQLRTNSISVHTKLVKLNLSHNKLSFIPHDLFKATTSGLTTGRQINLVSSIRYLNLAHNHIQTIDNINFRPLKNLLTLDLSHNELQTLGVDVILMDPKSIQHEQNNRRVIVSSNLTNLPVDDEVFSSSSHNNNRTSDRQARSNKFLPPATNWPALSKLRHLNVANNQLILVNQSLISELSPFALLNLDLSFNYLETESLPYGFYSKITTASKQTANAFNQQENKQQQTNYDLVFTLKLESLDLSHNKLNEFPTNLLDNHYTSMESCNISHNRIQNLAANSNLMLQIKALNLEFNPLSRESNELVLYEQRSVRYLNLAATRLYAIQKATVATTDQAATHAQNKYRLVDQTSQLDLIRSISKPINAPYLRHLNLSSNQLVWLAANVFDRMHSLQVLDLSNNQLTRLHLLNNPLMHVSSSLEYLNMASNLFTSIDSNDFSQLSKIRHLDLSNLLSLQKMNCKFISKLSGLRTLKMFNYPQLRQNINNILITISSAPDTQERLQRKLMNELVMSSLGRHCFQDGNYNGVESIQQPSPVSMWIDLEHLELELFNNFWHNNKQQVISGGGFRLGTELSQLLGPRLKVLTLFGLNLTSLNDDSLFGITNEELKLKISYTSMTQLPLRQLLTGLAKRTRLNLDFMNNNIQSIDARSLQLLDELQSNNQILQRGDHSSLKLGSNPIRCDCQTRPLWLWLNQRWANPQQVDTSSTGVGQDQDSSSSLLSDLSTISSASNPSAANYWPRFKSISYTSDLKCHYPLKLRGKPTQHVNYNDLVCKGATQTIVANRQPVSSSRKKNETRPSDSYYITSSQQSSGNGDPNEPDDVTNDDDYLDFAETKLQPEASVRATKFNKYPANIYDHNGGSGGSLQLWSSVSVPAVAVQERPAEEFSLPSLAGHRDVQDQSAGEAWNRKRGNRGLTEPASSMEYGAESRFDGNQQQVNTNYNKHRPNIHQRHSHYDTVGPLNLGSRTQHLKAGASVIGRQHHHHSSTHSMLTDIDVLILTVSSIAMIIMSFIIIITCLYKYKMDQSGKEQILDGQSKFLASQQAILFNSNNIVPIGAHIAAQSSSESSSKTTRMKFKQLPPDMLQPLKMGNRAEAISLIEQSMAAAAANKATNLKQMAQQPTTLPTPTTTGAAAAASGQLLPPAAAATADNFLMRSPTIRRMHGFATNASDWFKFTLRAYPPQGAAAASGGGAGAHNRRRHLLSGKNVPTGSQLTTAQLISSSHFDKNSKLLPAHLSAGCPVHAFRSIHRLNDTSSAQQPDEQCQHCRRLVAAVKRTKVNYVIGGGTHDETSSSSNTSSTVQEVNKQQPEVAAAATRAAKVRGDASDDTVIETTTKSAQQDQYLLPKMIRAQKAISQQQEQQSASTPSVSQGRREQRNGRPLRTFGSNGASGGGGGHPKLFKADHQICGNRDDTSGAHIRSQIPSVDIEGRFAYQSDSNYDSPACNANSVQGSRPDTRTDIRSSSIIGDPAEMFILVHDSNQGSIVDGGQTQTMDSSASHNDLLKNRSCISDNLINEFNSMMNDECSHSSSPVAYGFMRSSPSATTLSSVTTAPNHCIVANTTNQSGYNDTNHNYISSNNNNNHNTGYWAPSKEERETPQTTTSTTDDQIIISRL